MPTPADSVIRTVDELREVVAPPNDAVTMKLGDGLDEQLGARGNAAVLGIRVHVEEVFFHCAKAFIRSHLWKHETWPPKRKVSFGAMFAAKMGRAADEDLVAVIDDLIETDYAENL